MVGQLVYQPNFEARKIVVELDDDYNWQCAVIDVWLQVMQLPRKIGPSWGYPGVQMLEDGARLLGATGNVEMQLSAETLREMQDDKEVVF